MILVDTSAWIEQIRPGGREDVRGRVELLLITGEAAWCPIIRLELWNGARGKHEHRMLSEMQSVLPELEIIPDVWDDACSLARAARTKGITVPPQDLLVLCCARYYKVGLEHCDSHFDQLQELQ